MSYGLRNTPRSPWSLYGSVVEHRSAESEGLKFDSSRGLIILSLSHACDKTKKTSFFICLLSSKLTISLIFFYKHYAIDIADPSSIQDACQMNFVIDLAYSGVSMAQW